MKVRNLSSSNKKTVTLDLSCHTLEQDDVELIDHNHFRFGGQYVTIDQTTIVEILGYDEKRYRISGPAGLKHFEEFCETLVSEEADAQEALVEDDVESGITTSENISALEESPLEEPPLEILVQKKGVLDKLSRLSQFETKSGAPKELPDVVQAMEEQHKNADMPVSNRQNSEEAAVNVASEEKTQEANVPVDVGGVHEERSVSELKVEAEENNDHEQLNDRIRQLEQEKLHWLQEKLSLTSANKEFYNRIEHLEQEVGRVTVHTDQLLAVQKTSKQQSNAVASSAEESDAIPMPLKENDGEVARELDELKERYRKIEKRLAQRDTEKEALEAKFNQLEEQKVEMDTLLEKEREQHKMAREQQQDIKSEFDAQQQKYAALEQENHDLIQVRSMLVEEKKELVQYVETLETNTAEQKERVEQAEQLSSALKEEKDGLIQKYQVAQDKVDSLSGALEEEKAVRQQEKEAFAHQLERIKYTQQEIEERFEKQHQSFELLKQEKAELSTKHQHTVEEAQVLKQALENMQQESQQEQEEMKQHQLHQQENEEKTAALYQQSVELKQQLTNQKLATAALKEQHIALESAYAKERKIRQQIEQKLVEVEKAYENAMPTEIETAQLEMAKKVLSDLSGDAGL